MNTNKNYINYNIFKVINKNTNVVSFYLIDNSEFINGISYIQIDKLNKKYLEYIDTLRTSNNVKLIISGYIDYKHEYQYRTQILNELIKNNHIDNNETYKVINIKYSSIYSATSFKPIEKFNILYSFDIVNKELLLDQLNTTYSYNNNIYNKFSI